jgi:hypothetical protein
MGEHNVEREREKERERESSASGARAAKDEEKPLEET